MSNLSTLPKGDSAWLLRKAIERIIQQVSVLETNIGSSTTGNSANTQIIFNDAGTLRGDAGLTYNKTTDLLTVGAATITGDLTVDTSTLKVDSANDAVGVGTATPASYSGSKLSLYTAANTLLTIAQATSYSNLQSNGYDLYINTNVGGANSNAGNFIIRHGSGSTEQFRIASDGVATWSNVGGVAGTAMTLNATGLGVGTSPTNKLDVSSSDAAVTLRVNTQNAGASASNYSQIQLSDVGTVRSYWRNVRDGAGTTQFAYNSYLQFLSDAAGTPTERMRIDAAGNVGVGVTPSAWAAGGNIELNGSTGNIAFRVVSTLACNWYYNSGDKFIGTGYAQQYQQYQGVHKWFTSTLSGSAGGSATMSQLMTLDASGNLLVGTTSVLNSARVSFKTASVSSVLSLNGVAGDTLQESFVINKFDSNSTTSQVFARFTNGNGANGSGQINGNGANACAFGSFSDARLKENIVSLPSQLANILSLRPVEFDYKDGSGHQIGFVAQEIQEVYADTVAEQNGFLTLTGWGKTEARLVSAIKELAAKVQALEAKLA